MPVVKESALWLEYDVGLAVYTDNHRVVENFDKLAKISRTFCINPIDT